MLILIILKYNFFCFRQVLQGGATEPPTKPKGRPRKESAVTIATTDNSSLSTNQKSEGVTSLLVQMSPKTDIHDDCDSESDIASDVGSDLSSDVESDIDIQNT